MYDEIDAIGNPYFIQTIELLKYLDKLKEFKATKSSRIEIGKLPKLRCKSTKLVNDNKYTKESVDEMCKKIMILLLTHAGYHKVDPECFNLLNDLFQSYLKNLTSLFRKKLDQDTIVNSHLRNQFNNDRTQSNQENQDQLILLGKMFNEIGLSFGSFQSFNYQLVLYRDHLLKQIEDLKIELKLPIDE